MTYVRLSCTFGLEEACNELAHLYVNHFGGDELWEAARIFARECFGPSAPLGCYDLADLLWKPVVHRIFRSTPPMDYDRTTSVALFLRACMLGDGDGCWRVGTAREIGGVVPRDMNGARAMYDRACRLGHAGACARAECLTLHPDAVACPSVDPEGFFSSSSP